MGLEDAEVFQHMGVYWNEVEKTFIARTGEEPKQCLWKCNCTKTYCGLKVTMA